MQTRKALQAMTRGSELQLGDPGGPLSRIAARMLATFGKTEAERLDRAGASADLAGSGPMLEVLRRRFAEAEASSLHDLAAPLVMRFDAYNVLSDAARARPSDRGLRLCAAHAKELWTREPDGVLAVGDVARMRTHWMREFPRSAVAQVIDTELTQVGFNTLPVAKLAQMATHIRGQDAAELESSYETVVAAHGLTGNAPHQIRARAYLRGLVHLAAEDAAPAGVGVDVGGAAAAERALRRMAAFDDPILRSVHATASGEVFRATGQLDMEPELAPEDGDGGGAHGPGEDPAVEGEVPHDEESEKIVETESPITGEPVVLELGVPEGEPGLGEEAGMMPPPGGPGAMPGAGPGGPGSGLDVVPEDVQGLSMFGQLEDFVDEQPDMNADEMAGEPGDIPMADEGSGETVTQVEDPTAPGEMLEVVLRPATPEGEAEGLPAVPSDIPLEGEGGESAGRLARRRGAMVPFAVYAIRGGRKATQPLERFVAESMPRALARVARSLGELHSSGGAVKGHPDTFHRHALVVLDEAAGNHLYVVAEAERGDEFRPAVIQQQPGQVSVPKDGGEALKSNGGFTQDRAYREISVSPGPSAVPRDGDKGETKPGPGPKGGSRTRAMSKREIEAACAALGFSRDAIEASLLAGDAVVQGSWALELDDSAAVRLMREGAVVRTASVAELDGAIDDFMARVAVVSRGRIKVATKPEVAPVRNDGEVSRAGGQAVVHQLFRVGCAQCGGIDEYVMPSKTAAAVRCSGCGYTTSAASVAVQLEAKTAQQSYPGYLLVAPIPGAVEDREMNARRLMAAIQEVVPSAEGTMRTATIEVALRPVDEKQLARIRNVLATKFGVGFKATVTARKDEVRRVRAQGGATTQEMQSTLQSPVSPLTVQSPTTPTNTTPSPNTPAQTGPTMPTAVRPNLANPMPLGGGPGGIENPQTTGIQAPGMAGGPGGPDAPGGSSGPADAAKPGMPVSGARLWNVTYQRAGRGQVMRVPVEAASAAGARKVLAAYEADASVLSVKPADEVRRVRGQAAPPPPPEAAPDAGGAPPPMPGAGGDAAGAVPGGDLGAGGAAAPGGLPTPGPGDLPPEAVDVIKASFIALRNTGVDIASGIQEFLSQFRQWLDGFGDKQSPSRQKVGGVIVDAAREAWSKPAILQVAPKMASLIQAGLARSAAESVRKMPTPGKVKTQHGPYVKVPSDAAKLLGQDSATDPKVTESIVPGGKIKTQPSKPHGTGKLSPTGWGDHVLTENKDPGRFDAEMPPANGSYGFLGPGTSLTPTDLGSDSMTGGNATTDAWDGVAQQSQNNPRSKPGGQGAPSLRKGGELMSRLARLQVRPQSMAARHLASAIAKARAGHWPEDELWAARDAGLEEALARFPEGARQVVTAALNALSE